MGELEDRWGDIWHPINGSWSSHDHVRHFQYEDISRFAHSWKWEDKDYKLIEFGCREPTSSIMRIIVHALRSQLPHGGMYRDISLFAADYPEHDLQYTRFEDNSWDITVADQVLEHVKRLWLAAEELHRITKPGGICIVCTPFIHPIHPNPIDCWRIAPDGYKVIFPDHLWEYLYRGMWGDRDTIVAEYTSPKVRGLSGDWMNVAEASQQPFYKEGSDGLNPIVIWNVMQKL